MDNPIQKLHFAFNMLNDFEPAHTSDNHREMLVKIDDKVYVLKLEDISESDLSIELVNKYLR